MSKRGKRSAAGKLRQNVRAMHHLQRLTYDQRAGDPYAGNTSAWGSDLDQSATRRPVQSRTRKSGPVNHLVREVQHVDTADEAGNPIAIEQRVLVPYEDSQLLKRRTAKTPPPMTAQEQYVRRAW